ncbi:carotenoid oxygenase family protein [Thalassomonas viridans]|uniref:Carotenoid oxygenase family protein n=1 Tax=Thalassomonas viridans TaxID=137584 RepID=A0AAF0C9P0_9GAMM|nr:carotenoid oxygenase family protein [Thalassomonas viridans]WDE07722.1 carotenoid oxygenase family protein [Thalassomonas viridans]
MNRRNFIKNLSLIAGSSLVASPLTQVLAKTLEPASQLSSPKELFARALRNNPALTGFANVKENFALKELTLEGKMPGDLSGIFYRVGPAGHERANLRYKHLFEGDGMIHSFNFANGKIFHQGKFINTPKFVEEKKAGKFLYSGPDTKIPGALGVHNADSINTSNTNAIAVGDKLWTLWEAGSPMQVDPYTLESSQWVNLGENSRFGQSLQGMPFSAHPKVDPSGDIFNFGLNGNGQAVLYHLAANGRLKNAAVVNAGYRGMLHDFLITHKHILLILPSLSVDGADKGFFERTRFVKEQPMRVLVIDKAGLTVQKSYQLPPGFAFHFGNAWEERDGTIHFDASLYPDISSLHNLSAVMQGKTDQPASSSQTVLYTLKPNGGFTQQYIEGDSEFPKIYDHLVGQRNTLLYTTGSKNNPLWADSIRRLNTDTGLVDEYYYGEDYLVEEHVITTDKPREGSGYLVGTALHIPSKRTCINLFQADSLSQGPIMRAWLPYHIPLGFHGNFQRS